VGSYVPGTNRTGRPWQRLKARVLRASTICHLCDQDGADTADHIEPVSHGGAVYDIHNLAPAHIECNNIRGNRSVAEGRRLVAERKGKPARAGWYHPEHAPGCCPHSLDWGGMHWTTP
jgi:5-methylcytosine-specific restriction endonuclease McrA